MGHLGQLKKEYRDLVERLAAGSTALPEPEEGGNWEGFRDILEILYSPEDAALASRLPMAPTDGDTLSRRLGIPFEDLKPHLDALCDKGLVVDWAHPKTGRDVYFLSPPVIGFFEYSFMRAADGVPKKRMAEALEAYLHGNDTFVQEVFGHETRHGRTLVHETALGEEQLPEVLDWERTTRLVRKARGIAVSLCYCRHKNEHLGKACGAPKENCLSLDAGADFIVRRKFGRPITQEEAMDILAASRANGLIQIADNVKNRPAFICNCCSCCCSFLQGVNEFDLPAINPSGFLARPDLSTCAGCSRCARACPVAAIRMAAVRDAGKPGNRMVPEPDEERCIGCGVCADVCGRKAMRMVRRSEQPCVPDDSVEKTVRMIVERGRSAYYWVADEAERRGSRFLGRIFRVLAGFPIIQRVLASKRLRPLIVQAILDRSKDLSDEY